MTTKDTNAGGVETDWSYAFDSDTLRDRFGGSFMATEPDENGNVAVLLSQADARAIVAALTPPATGEAAAQIEAVRVAVGDFAKRTGGNLAAAVDLISMRCAAAERRSRPDGESALRWYEEEIAALARHSAAQPPNTTAMSAIVQVLSIDGGAKARAALAPSPPPDADQRDDIRRKNLRDEYETFKPALLDLIEDVDMRRRVAELLAAAEERAPPGGVAITTTMVNAAWIEAKTRRMTGLPTDFRAVLEAAGLVANASPALPTDLGRRVDVENVLLAVAGGKRGPLSADECRDLAYRLGVTDEHRKAAATAVFDAMDTTLWKPAETAKEGRWLITGRAGEKGLNLCCRTGDEWHDQAGRSTVTHHSMAAPTHWLDIQPPEEPKP